MSSKLYTAALTGLDCTIVEVEVDYRRGNAYFSVVGLADKSIQEAKDRIPSAIRNSGAEFVPMKIIINLAPAELIKSGPSYDLALAVGYLLASEQVKFDPRGKIFLGELALDGRLRSISGVLPIVSAVKEAGFTEVFLPEENKEEASYVDNIQIYPVKHLKELINHANGDSLIEPYTKKRDISTEKIVYTNTFEGVRGQVVAKRALEVAAAGGHNILLHGVPGAGKSLLSKCIPSILPDMTFEESLEVTKLYSVSGLTKGESFLKRRPFRSPHHTASHTALVGGGRRIRPGEISLAHRGVLFLDEFPEFSGSAIEALRQPIEDRKITISRASGRVEFPANFMLVAAMNPCKCGFYGSPEKECTCTAYEISQYQKKVSGPILDRIDLHIKVERVKNLDLFDTADSETSEEVKQRVQKARDIQLERYKDVGIFSNSELSQTKIDKFIIMDKKAKEFLKLAVERLNLSARAYFKVQKVARTIADLDETKAVEQTHVAESLQYR